MSKAFRRDLLLRHIPADDEVPPFRFGPEARPDQRHNAAILMDVACLEVSRAATVTGLSHLVSHTVEVIREHEFCDAPPDHLLRVISQDLFGTWADADKSTFGIDDLNKIQRSFEKAAPLLRFSAEGGRGSPELRFGRGSFACGGWEPAQSQKAKYRRRCYHVHELGKDQIVRTAK